MLLLLDFGEYVPVSHESLTHRILFVLFILQYWYRNSAVVRDKVMRGCIKLLILPVQKKRILKLNRVYRESIIFLPMLMGTSSFFRNVSGNLERSK